MGGTGADLIGFRSPSALEGRKTHNSAHGNAGFRHFKLITPALGPGRLGEGPASWVPPFGSERLFGVERGGSTSTSVLPPLSIDGEFGEAVSECERLKTSSSRRSARFFLIWVKTGARRGETVKVVGWWM